MIPWFHTDDQERAQRGLTAVAVCFGVYAILVYLAAFPNELESIFAERDNRFVMLLVSVSATASALASRGVGLALGLVALFLSLTYEYGQFSNFDIDTGYLRWNVAGLVVFNLLLAGSLYYTRDD